LPHKISDETQILFDAADRAIARSHEIIAERRQRIEASERGLREQEMRFIFRREALKQK
jgi:hypothetical protein